MPVVLGIDLGTTTITALALDTADGSILACRTRPNDGEITSPTDKARGRSEWDATRIASTACSCLREVAAALGERLDLAGLGITGQQHGVVLVGEAGAPVSPFISWQDRRTLERYPQSEETFVGLLAEVLRDQSSRTGCRLAAGYMGATLAWLKREGVLPAGARACFLMDYFAARLTGRPPVTDPTCSASSGIFDVSTGRWSETALAALDLPPELFPEVRPSGEVIAGLSADMAEATGLPAGLPVCVGIGDNQASFVGSVADRSDTVLVNVGTGGQVAAWMPRFVYDPLLETRPFPRGGYLLVSAGLVGGRTYALLEAFYRQVGRDLFGLTTDEPLYAAMNRLAARAARGAGGLSCEPFFSGTRAEPERRAAFTGLSAENFTPANLTRALLEGMAWTFREGRTRIKERLGRRFRQLVGAGNGLRENAVLARAVAEEFGWPLAVPAHREEAAFGAALVAGVGAGACSSLEEAGRLIRYEAPSN